MARLHDQQAAAASSMPSKGAPLPKPPGLAQALAAWEAASASSAGSQPAAGPGAGSAAPAAAGPYRPRDVLVLYGSRSRSGQQQCDAPGRTGSAPCSPTAAAAAAAANPPAGGADRGGSCSSVGADTGGAGADSSAALLREEENRYGLLPGTLSRLELQEAGQRGAAAGSSSSSSPRAGTGGRGGWSPGSRLDTFSRQLAPPSWQAQVQQVRL